MEHNLDQISDDVVAFFHDDVDVVGVDDIDHEEDDCYYHVLAHNLSADDVEYDEWFDEKCLKKHSSTCGFKTYHF